MYTPNTPNTEYTLIGEINNYKIPVYLGTDQDFCTITMNAATIIGLQTQTLTQQNITSLSAGTIRPVANNSLRIVPPPNQDTKLKFDEIELEIPDIYITDFTNTSDYLITGTLLLEDMDAIVDFKKKTITTPNLDYTPPTEKRNLKVKGKEKPDYNTDLHISHIRGEPLII